ncbi:MAG: hypothetical protein A2Z15_01005 [Chloroflexi bacterium RBG_16_50_11]|nr:MAG: hypothetical protein A2Z15_01005 [Chloroflexi bacterium RBG_16_50_11]
MSFLIFIKDLLLATLAQMASLFLGIFIFGLLIQFISQLSFKSLGNAFGPGGTYLVAWLGTPVHELGHALFCLIFGHKIEEIRFFKPDKDTGTLGFVYHTWNPKNPWHVLGNFFIGIGPVVLGCAVLFALFYFLIPGSSRVWDSIIVSVNSIGSSASIGSYFTVFEDATLSIIKLIFNFANLSTWQFWVFLYLSICIASNVRLSWADVKGSFSGFGCVVLPFIILNLILLLAGRTTDNVFPYTASVLGGIYSLLILALIMVLIGFVLIYLFSATYYRLRYKIILNPFK